MALAIQVAVAALAAGLIAKWLGNEQSLLVAWTAYVVIAGSAEASTRRAWLWLAATILGATAGVAIAASVPDNIVWTVSVVTAGVFFTIVSAPVSYPAMVFWLNIALVPLFATQGRYLDLIRDKAVAALIGGASPPRSRSPSRRSGSRATSVRRCCGTWMHSMRPWNLSCQAGGTAGRKPGPNSTAPTRPWTPWSRRPPPRPTSFHNREAP